MDFQGFTSSGVKPIILQPAGSTTYSSLAIPKSAKFVYVLIIGAGGTGGNGFIRAANANGGGGGGGGAGAIARALIPASLFSGTLFYRVAERLARTGVWLKPSGIGDFGGALIACNSGADGGNGTSTAVGSSGAGGILNVVPSRLIIYVATAGLNGLAGGNITGGNGGISSTSTIPTTMGGAGGAGCATANFAGGNCTYSTVLAAQINGGLADVAGNDGANSYPLLGGLTEFGGAGGGSTNAGVAGAGGKGGIGCGGGGGGVGQTAGTGLGGMGGYGQIMVWWL